MKISSIKNNTYTKPENYQRNNNFGYSTTALCTTKPVSGVSFKGFNPAQKIAGYLTYRKAQKYADKLKDFIDHEWGKDKFTFRECNLEPLEGIQYNIKVFKDLSIKEIQYLCENLHVIAVKRGCKKMCGYCYADAKPSKREMTYEDFHSITDGFKTLRKRLHNIDIYGENLPYVKDQIIYRTTELFYDADCMDIALKNKKGREFDFIDLSTELFDSLGRKTAFDTSGWYKNNTKLQQRAEKYAKHFAQSQNMEKLNAFNVSFNVFNQSYISSVKAMEKGDKEKALRLRERFVSDMANTLFTFTPIAQSPKFSVLLRAFHPSEKSTKNFNANDLILLCREVLKKLKDMYTKDLAGEQKVIKSKEDLNKFYNIFENKLSVIDTGLNSSGRMAQFIKDHNIKTTRLQDHAKITPQVINYYKENARRAPLIMQRYIDTDGRVYNMDYARFLKTEIQLNINGKDTPTPALANLVENFVITKKNIKE